MNHLSFLTVDTDISVADAIACLTFLALIISGIFALIKWNKSLKLKRAEYIKTLFDEIREKEQIQKVFNLFEYNERWYCKDFHNSNGNLEHDVDYTLRFFSYICYLYEQRIIGNAEFNSFKYEIHRILTNTQFQQYFYNLYHFSVRQKQPITFLYLLRYAKKNKYLDDEFWNSKSKYYQHILNF